MSLCHLYYKHTTSHHVKAILEYFKSSVSIDISVRNEIDTCEIYIIELEEVDKDISLKVKELFKQKLHSLIYFIVPQKHNLMFFQLSYLLNAKNLILQNMNTEKAIERIIEDQKISTEETLQQLVGKADFATLSFMIYKNMSLEQVSGKLLKDFRCETLESFQNTILNQLDVQGLLSKDGEIERAISIKNGFPKKYSVTSVSLMNDMKIMYVDELSSLKESTLDLISSRIAFVELLKEKLLQKDIANNGFDAITINIQNFEKLQNELAVLPLEELLIDLLGFIKSILEKKVVFAEIAINFYVILFEEMNEDEINNLANNINAQIINYISSQMYKPLIDIYTLNLNSLDLSEILSTLNHIMKVDLSQEEQNSIKIKHISKLESIIDEQSLLEDAFKYSSEIKLLNIYHGLVINTPSKILSIAKNTITIRFEALQGVVINLDQKTILQSAVFLHDIEAKVKKIDLTRRIVMLEKFKFLDTNINARRYSRVTTVNKTPISLFVSGVSLNGYIVDLSIKSIAIYAKYVPLVDTMQNENVSLTFNIPNPKAELGFSRLNVEGTVIAVIIDSNQDTCKIICDIEEYNTHDSLLIQYIYDRQKELILELKKSAQLH
ncbi:MAG: PilZ domain-containing protein [Thiovulaceae bacterium]|nr:PilZ domain-containing protein [Sulfurimonadaceae bacterium]